MLLYGLLVSMISCWGASTWKPVIQTLSSKVCFVTPTDFESKIDGFLAFLGNSRSMVSMVDEIIPYPNAPEKLTTMQWASGMLVDHIFGMICLSAGHPKGKTVVLCNVIRKRSEHFMFIVHQLVHSVLKGFFIQSGSKPLFLMAQMTLLGGFSSPLVSAKVSCHGWWRLLLRHGFEGHLWHPIRSKKSPIWWYMSFLFNSKSVYN